MEPRFHPDALVELEQEGAERGEPFVTAVEQVVAKALETPGAGALWPSLPPDLGVRRRDIPRYKYMSLAYTVIDDLFWIVAVVHERRQPGYWLQRLDSLHPG